MRPLLLLLLGPVAAAGVQSPHGDVLLITGAVVIDGTDAEPRQADVLIRGDRIAMVGSELQAPAGVRTVDARGLTLLPGLFDLHTHLSAATAGNLSADWGKNLKSYLYCGITSVADLGTYPETFEPMRRLLHSGAVEGPRVALAARITTPGGHGAEGGRGDIYSLEALTPREGRAAVARILPYRPDLVKVFTDGWRYGFSPDMTSMEEDTLQAIVEEAHRAGVPVITHTVTLARAKIAARAGVDMIGHGIGDAHADSDLARLMKASHTYYVSTLAVYESKPAGIVPPLLEGALEPQALAAALGRESMSASAARNRRWENLMFNIAELRKLGVAFGAGTDAGMPNTHHGYASLRETELLVRGGLTPLQAIAAATGNSARALRVDADRGTVAAGKLADLVLVEGEPWRRIEDIERVSRVFLGGREIDRRKLRREIAAPGPSPLPPVAARAVIDDFESRDGRTRLGTLWVNSTDSGHDNSRMSFARTLRNTNNHALSVLVQMAEKDRPYARVTVPLTPGAVEPADARAFRGIAFEARGDGEYRLIVTTRAIRQGAPFQAPFQAGGNWSKVRIPFNMLRPGEKGTAQWSGADLQALSFEVARAAGQKGWLELDNLRFYR